MECQYFLSSLMVWEAEFTDEFEAWWNALSEAEQDDIDTAVRVLQQEGPLLREPLSKRIEASRHYPDMKELRISTVRGDRLRIFYAFDPRRTAILLIGGNKTGQWESSMMNTFRLRTSYTMSI